MFNRLFAAVLVALFATSAIAADAPRQIGWEDLMPKAEPLKNPFDEIDLEIREDLGFIFRTKADLELGLIEADSPEMQQAHKVSMKVEAAGVDIDALEDELDRLQAELDRRDQMVNPELDGAVVRIPG